VALECLESLSLSHASFVSGATDMSVGLAGSAPRGGTRARCSSGPRCSSAEHIRWISDSSTGHVGS